MMEMMAAHDAGATDHAADLLRLYDGAVDEVYRYLRSRCGRRQTAEDLTADVFLAAVGQVQRDAVEEVSVPWLIGIARHKLVDHWRRTSRRPQVVDTIDIDTEPVDEAGDETLTGVLDRHQVQSVMEELADHQRSALVLRYFDGLPVPEVADRLGRSVHATESLLVRARRDFRAAYARKAGDPT